MESLCRLRVCYCKLIFHEMAVFTKFQLGLIYAMKRSSGIFLKCSEIPFHSFFYLKHNWTEIITVNLFSFNGHRNGDIKDRTWSSLLEWNRFILSVLNIRVSIEDIRGRIYNSLLNLLAKKCHVVHWITMIVL